MIIQHNISAISSYRNLGVNRGILSKNLEKLSSGYKINRAGDNAIGLVISESMRSQINGLDQASVSAKDAVGLTKTAEDALSGTHPMFQHMTTLTGQAINGTYNTVARGNIQEEYKTLTKEIKRIPENADFNGTKPLAADEEMTMTFQIGLTSGETITVDREDTYGKTITVVMGLKPSAQNDAKNALRTIKATIGDVLTYRTKLGAAQNRLKHIVKSLDIMSEDITKAGSCIRDADIANEITAFTRNDILLRVAQSTFAQSGAVPQGILSLLQQGFDSLAKI